MTNKGRHASDSGGAFYRDLAIMIFGIIVVGAAVFFLLYLFADGPISGPTTTSASVDTTTTSEADVSTTVESVPTTSSTITTTTTVPVRPPSEVTVLVLNSVGLDGAAGRMTADVAAAGYQTITPTNYEPEQDPSRIWYREGFAAEANELLTFLPGALVELVPSEDIGEGADVILVLGTGYEE